MTDSKLKSYIDRILRSREREDAEKANTKEIYKELAGDGYDKTTVGKVVNHLRKDEEKAREQSERFDLYLAAYLGASHVHAHAREDESEHDADGVVIESTAAQGGQNVKADTFPTGHTHPQVVRQDLGGRDAAAVDTIIEPQPAMAAQTVQPHAAVANSVAVPESVESGASGGGDSNSAPASNVTPIHRHNPATHFLNSKNLPRLHGCKRPEACAGSHRALCFSCSVEHDGPAHQDGAA